MVTYQAGRVSIVANGEPLSMILARLADASGMELRGSLPSDPPTTVRFSDVPIETAVERLLGGNNYTMRFGADDTPLWLTLRGGPVAPQPKVQNALGEPNFFQLLNSHPPVALSAALANALQARRISPAGLARSIGAQKDPTIRLQMMQRLLTVIEGDTGLRQTLREVSTLELVRFARWNAKKHARELTEFLARRARDPQVRETARAASSILGEQPQARR